MKILALVGTLIAVIAVSAKPNPRSRVPKFQLRSWSSRSDVPTVDITFPDGHSDTLAISRHYPSEESRRERALHCNFLGHLENEMTACVAMTGCPGEDDLEFTVLSKHNDGFYMYRWLKDGTIEGVESDKSFSIMGQLVDDEVEIPASLRNETASSIKEVDSLSRSEVSDWDNCATNGNCDTLRPAMKLTVKVFYDSKFKEIVTSPTGDYTTPDAYIDAAFTHAQANYCDSDTLRAKIHIELVGGKTHAPELAIPSDLSLSSVHDRAITSDTGANVFSFFTHNTGPFGRGYIAVACSSS